MLPNERTSTWLHRCSLACQVLPAFSVFISDFRQLHLFSFVLYSCRLIGQCSQVVLPWPKMRACNWDVIVRWYNVRTIQLEMYWLALNLKQERMDHCHWRGLMLQRFSWVCLLGTVQFGWYNRSLMMGWYNWDSIIGAQLDAWSWSNAVESFQLDHTIEW